MLPINSYFSINGNLKSLNEYTHEKDGGSVYEVLRVIRGVPLFLDEHLNRLAHSAELAGFSNRFSQKETEEQLIQLIKANNVSEGNILISLKENIIAYFIPYKYPGKALYENGIQLGILHAERQNPNAKVFQTSVRRQADEMKLAKDYYEVLLVDHRNRITEGSSSNFFFVSGDRLVTATAGEVLQGITRNKTIRLAGELGIEVIERNIYLNEMPQFEAAFITGTSPKILHVKQIDDIKFDPQNHTIKVLMDAYDNLIENYVSAR